MVTVKESVHILATVTLFTFSHSLVAMKIPDKFHQKAQTVNKIEFKEPQKIEIIKKHDLKIVRNSKFLNTPDGIILGSVKVFHIPYILKSPLLIDGNSIAFISSEHKIQIINLQTGDIVKTIETKNQPNLIVAWGKNNIVFGDDEGNINILDTTKNHGDENIGTIKVSINPIKYLKNITKNIFVFHNWSIVEYDDPIFKNMDSDEDFDGFYNNQTTIGFLNLENINKPQLEYMTCPLNGGLFCGIEPAKKDTCVFWNSDGKIYQLCTKNTIKKIKPICEIPSGLSVLKKLSNEEYIAGFTDGETKTCDFKTKKKYKSSCNFLDINYCPPINQRVIDLLELPNNNRIICITPETIKLVDQRTVEWTHQINCHSLLSKTNDTISSVFYAAHKIFVITKNGYIISCSYSTKDLNYLFQNLTISTKQKMLQDVDFIFKETDINN